MKFGWLPEVEEPKPDRRIERLKLSKVDLPTEFSLLDGIDDIEIFDQGNTGTCGAQAVSAGARVIAAADLVGTVDAPPVIRLSDMPTPSRRWLYQQARCTHGGQYSDEGTYLSALLLVARVLGWPDEQTSMGWEQTIANDAGRSHDLWINQAPDVDTRHNAFDQRGALEEYAITYSRNLEGDIRAALAVERAPVVCGGMVTMDFLRLQDWVPFVFGNDEAGGHAVLIVGYDAGSYHIINSWGPSWGFGGLCRIERKSALSTLRDFHAITRCREATS